MERAEPPEPLKQIVARVSAVAGVAFDRYRVTTLSRRIDARMAQLGMTDLDGYRARIASDPAEAHALAHLLLVGTTETFRDTAVFELLASTLLPELVARRAAARARRLRLWSAGCSTGEEAYSLAALAMVAAEGVLEVDVLATDVSPVALERAARGVIPASRLGAIPPAIADRFFTPVADGPMGARDPALVVRPELRERVTFARHDLLDATRIAPREAVVASFDLVACRNVLIYLNTDACLEVTSRLLKACSPRGLLVLGTAEQVPDALHDQVQPLGPSIYGREPSGADV